MSIGARADEGVVLGVDLATSAARVTAVDVATGADLGFVGAPLAVPRHDRPGESRQHADHHLIVRSLLRRTAELLGDRASEVIALSVTGTSGTLIGVDATGAPVTDAVLYDDTSGVTLAAQLTSLGRPHGAGSVLVRMGLLARSSGVARIVSTADLVLADLAGHPVASDTSHFLKVGIDPATGSWPLDALAAAGVHDALLPALTAPGTLLRTLDPDRAQQLGLPSAVALVAGMTDGCTAQISCGAVEIGDTVGVLGTTLVLKGVSAERIDLPDGSIYSHCAPDGSWWPGGASNAGAGVLAGTLAHADLAALDQAAAAQGPADALRYPLSGVGERFPIADPTFVGWTVGAPRDRIEAHRAVLEGVAFVERLGLERLQSLGVQRGTHRLAGGGARSEVWNRVRATVLGCPVTIPRAGGSGRGAAVLAAAAVSQRSLAAVCRAWDTGSIVVDPDGHESARLEENYQRFSSHLESLGDRATGLPVPSPTRPFTHLTIPIHRPLLP